MPSPGVEHHAAQEVGLPGPLAPNDVQILLRAVTKVHGGQVTALHDLDLALEAGESVAIVGPSGSGKSTLLHLIGTLERPSTGEVWMNGRKVSELSDAELAGVRSREVGFVFQQFHLLKGLSARENVAESLLYSGTSRRTRIKRAELALAEVGLGDRMEHRPQQLSGGEQQRVAIARALLTRPSIVLADEPTGNLDSASGALVMGILRDLEASGTTVVMITHDKDLAATFSRQIELRDGRIVRDSRRCVT